MTTLATETFTGTNGAAWPGQWTIGAQPGTADIQSNQGRRINNTSDWTMGKTAYLSGMANTVDSEVYLEINFGNTLAEQYVGISLRSNGILSGDGNPYTQYGYTAVIGPTGESAVHRVVNSTITTLAGLITATWGAATDWYGVRFAVIGSAVGFKLWNVTTGSEPGSWDFSSTDSSPYTTAGKLFLAQTNGGNAAARTTLLDNITVTDTSALGAGAVTPGPVTVRSAVHRASTW